MTRGAPPLDDRRERHEKLSDLFLAAHDLEAEQRQEFLRSACAGDEALQQEVDALLSSDHELPTLLKTGGMVLPDEVWPERLPRRVGSYRVLGKLGEGGMGIVLLAEQERPVKRKVALKLIRPGLETEELQTRFRYEGLALARMNHPSIAHVYDAGVTRNRRSYVALEYVEGEPITVYCDRHRLGIRARLELFRRVCDGIQHAHQRAVIHRDIKPSNVLVATVDDRPVPKIIDFGIAKAIEEQPRGRSLTATFRGLLGTPEYMSPEQAHGSGRAVDTRTDIYSLGVLLYELLVGLLPFDPQDPAGKDLEHVRRTIGGQQPRRPSARVLDAATAQARAAARDEASPTALAKRLRGDLDWITLKALAHDPDRRYASASELACDVERFSRDEPVLAGPPSTLYRLRKMAVRHRNALIAVTVLLLLLGSLTGLWIQNRRVVHERAQGAEVLLEALAQAEHGPVNRTEPFEELLATSLRVTLGKDHPETLAFELGLVRERVSSFALEGTEARLRGIHESARRTLGSDALLTLRAQVWLGRLYTRLKRPADAEPLIREALASLGRTVGADHPDTLFASFCLGSQFAWQGRWKEAEAIHVEALPRLRRVLGDLDPVTLGTKYNLACAAALRGDKTCAIDYLTEALEGGFAYYHRGEDGVLVGGAKGILQDPPLMSLHGDPDFENLVLEEGYVGQLREALKHAAHEPPHEVKPLVQQALDRGFRHREWLADAYPLIWILEHEPEFRDLFDGSSRVPPPPRCTPEGTDLFSQK